MAQWLKNLTTAARVTMEAWVQSLVWELPYAEGEAIQKRKKMGVPIVAQQK